MALSGWNSRMIHGYIKGVKNDVYGGICTGQLVNTVYELITDIWTKLTFRDSLPLWSSAYITLICNLAWYLELGRKTQRALDIKSRTREKNKLLPYYWIRHMLILFSTEGKMIENEVKFLLKITIQWTDPTMPVTLNSALTTPPQEFFVYSYIK